MINHNLFFEKWLDLASTEAQEEAMKKLYARACTRRIDAFHIMENG